MRGPTIVTCEWSGCESPAQRLVSFGYRIAEPEVVPVVHELNLCSGHIAEIEQQFRVISVDDPGDDDSPKHSSAFRHVA